MSIQLPDEYPEGAQAVLWPLKMGIKWYAQDRLQEVFQDAFGDRGAEMLEAYLDRQRNVVRKVEGEQLTLW